MEAFLHTKHTHSKPLLSGRVLTCLWGTGSRRMWRGKPQRGSPHPPLAPFCSCTLCAHPGKMVTGTEMHLSSSLKGARCCPEWPLVACARFPPCDNPRAWKSAFPVNLFFEYLGSSRIIFSSERNGLPRGTWGSFDCVRAGAASQAMSVSRGEFSGHPISGLPTPTLTPLATVVSYCPNL